MCKSHRSHRIPGPPAWTLTPCGRSAACRSSSRWHDQQRPASQSARMHSLWTHSHHTPPAGAKPVIHLTAMQSNEEIFTQLFYKSDSSWGEAVRLRLRRSYLTGQDVPEGWEGIIQGLVINGLVQIFDEDISNAWLAERRVSLWPHDPDGLPLHHVEVHRVKSSLSYKANRWKGKKVNFCRFPHLSKKTCIFYGFFSCPSERTLNGFYVVPFKISQKNQG